MTNTTFFYAANHEGESAYKLASLVNIKTPEYEVSCTKLFSGGRCTECTLAYQLVGETVEKEVFTYFRGNPPSQWKIYHAEDMAHRSLKKIRILESEKTKQLEAA